MFYILPTIIPTDNVFHAILFGIFSGLSSTGTHQLVKQLKQLSSNDSIDSNNTEKPETQNNEQVKTNQTTKNDQTSITKE